MLGGTARSMECIEDIKTLGNAIRDDETKDAFVSWSGGKDCCLSLYRAVSKGLNVRYLASMITENTGRLFPHYLTPEILRMQAEAIGIPMIQQRVRLPDHMRRESKVADYDTSYIEMLGRMKEQGINVGVFGDVSIGNRFVKDHLRRVKSFCSKAGIKPYLP